MDHRTVTYRKLYRKLKWPVFTSIRPYTGSGYYAVGELYDHYYRRRFLSTAPIIKKIAPVKLKNVPLRIIEKDVDPPHNTIDGFYTIMEKFYKDNYFRPNFWKERDTQFQILWFQKIPELSAWA